jgi:hypothetical protein
MGHHRKQKATHVGLLFSEIGSTLGGRLLQELPIPQALPYTKGPLGWFLWVTWIYPNFLYFFNNWVAFQVLFLGF